MTKVTLVISHYPCMNVVAFPMPAVRRASFYGVYPEYCRRTQEARWRQVFLLAGAVWFSPQYRTEATRETKAFKRPNGIHT